MNDRFMKGRTNDPGMLLLDVDKQQQQQYQQQQDRSDSSKSSSRSIVGRGGKMRGSTTGNTGSNSGNLKAGRPVAAPPRQGRGKAAPTATAAQLRQTTLTQIDFVQRIIPPPDDELELELEVIQPEIESEGKQDRHQQKHQHQQNQQKPLQQLLQNKQQQQQQSHVPMEPPRKRRKVSKEPAKPDVLTRHDSSFKLATLGPGKQASETSSSFELDLPVFHENERLGHELAQRFDEDAELGSPRTPKHIKRTVVPSSQSPDVTPLSIRTGRRSKNTSPIKSPPGRNRYPTISPKKSESQVDNFESSKRLRVRHVVSDQENQSPRIKSEDMLETEAGDKIRPLRLFSPRRSPSSSQSKLEASPNAPTQKPTAQKLKKQGSMEPPRNRPPAQVPSSQATTEDPSEVSSPAETRASARRSKQVPSSQASTQDPSQPSQGAPAPSSKLAASASGVPGVRIKTPESSSPRAPLGRVASRVHSSQATTVIEPLSSSAEAEAEAEETTPRPRKGKSPERQYMQVQTGNPRSPPSAPAPISSPAPAGWNHSQWQWDGKEVTDSQLLPDSLMNWSIPFPSSLSSQGSVGSVASVASLPPHEGHEINDRLERDQDGSTPTMKRGGQVGNQNQAGRSQAGRGRSKRAKGTKGASPEVQVQVQVKEEDISDNELMDDRAKTKTKTRSHTNTKSKTKKGAKTGKTLKAGKSRKEKSPRVLVKDEPTTD